jgi:hypothetical protein
MIPTTPATVPPAITPDGFAAAVVGWALAPSGAGRAVSEDEGAESEDAGDDWAGAGVVSDVVGSAGVVTVVGISVGVIVPISVGVTESDEVVVIESTQEVNGVEDDVGSLMLVTGRLVVENEVGNASVLDSDMIVLRGVVDGNVSVSVKDENVFEEDVGTGTSTVVLEVVGSGATVVDEAVGSGSLVDVG